MRVERQLPIGQNLESAGLPTEQVRLVQVDNPSGQWLRLYPTYDYIAPYTIGFIRTFATTVTAVSVRVEAPAGQVSTSAGDPVRVILDSVASVSDSNGVPFITEFTPNFANIMPVVDVPLSTGLSTNLIPGTLGRRIRLTALSVTLGGFPANPFSAGRAISAVTWTLIDTVTFDNRLVGRVTPDNPIDARSFVPGIDFPEFAALTFVASTDFADSRIGVSANSQLI